MEYRQTSYQVAQGARPDAETSDKILLQKKVQRLRGTYQVRLLLLKAMETGKMLRIIVPPTTVVDSTLQDLARLSGKVLSIERSR